MQRSPEVQAAYDDFIQGADDTCGFCHVGQQLVRAYEAQLVIKNLFPYSIWDHGPVKDHLMIIPKRHLLSLSEQTEEEKIEYVNIISEYETKGYSIYARAPQNTARSVAHIHTHLILLESA